MHRIQELEGCCCSLHSKDSLSRRFIFRNKKLGLHNEGESKYEMCSSF